MVPPLQHPQSYRYFIPVPRRIQPVKACVQHHKFPNTAVFERCICLCSWPNAASMIYGFLIRQKRILLFCHMFCYSKEFPDSLGHSDSIWFYCILWYSVLFDGILWYSVLFSGKWSASTLFHGILWYSMELDAILQQLALMNTHLDKVSSVAKGPKNYFSLIHQHDFLAITKTYQNIVYLIIFLNKSWT